MTIQYLPDEIENLSQDHFGSSWHSEMENIPDYLLCSDQFPEGKKEFPQKWCFVIHMPSRRQSYLHNILH